MLPGLVIHFCIAKLGHLSFSNDTLINQHKKYLFVIKETPKSAFSLKHTQFFKSDHIS